MKCRFCQATLTDRFLDLGSAPPSNAFLTEAELNAPETYFPLRLFTCSACHLVQVDEVQKHDALFSSSYVYFSSYSRTWLAHAEKYVETVAGRLSLDQDSLVMEVASNDGYLLQYVKARGIPCVGIEPTASTAAVARERGIESLQRFFGLAFARQFTDDRRPVDLLIGNNVLAHVPDINDFVAGIAAVLATDGVATIEFPHLLQLVAQRQFDTVYHEHFSYFSLHTVQKIFAAHGLRVWDVDELPTHGGSLRLWASRTEDGRRETPSVAAVLARESSAGMMDMDYYHGFQPLADSIKNEFLAFLLECKRAGKRVAGYGAAAKGNTLLNYAGVKPDLFDFVVDASPHKQGLYLPGTHIPVVSEQRLRDSQPEFVVVLPWNLRQEITDQLRYIREWGGSFVTAIPTLVVS
jgi:SAM-dependent methyltransferase